MVQFQTRWATCQNCLTCGYKIITLVDQYPESLECFLIWKNWIFPQTNSMVPFPRRWATCQTRYTCE
ncbi:receptor-like protein kinase 2 [Phtheirospermum japonicum]|uniref:Receptor-like protein kinase 2 n=1 Tax=Phtheirospermum japonicum TaxID=374723 RepID=A0A830D202_9LAMI|nr:receptor-like protein kinase 2 [Phtheirospermum japonicum]